MSTSIPRPPYLRLSLFTAVLALMIYGINHLKPEWIYPDVTYIIVFFLFIFLLSYFIIQLSFSQADPKKSVIIHLSAMVIRMILCIVAAFVFLKFDPDHHKLFVANFLVVYLLYLGFEIYSLLSNLRPDLKS